jgi:hypothetical protein
VRWRALFDDLEGQLAAAAAAELDAEVAERTRTETGRVRAADRLAAALGSPVALTVDGAGAVRGVLADTGPDWLLLDEGAGREVLVALPAVLSVGGLARGTAVQAEGPVARALDLRRAVRGLARDRAGVVVVLRDGSLVSGTVDRVGADFIEVAEHPPGEARRAAAVRGVRLVALGAVALVRGS